LRDLKKAAYLVELLLQDIKATKRRYATMDKDNVVDLLPCAFTIIFTILSPNPFSSLIRLDTSSLGNSRQASPHK